ncbi:Paired amphipathic helix protein Sin3b [Choanephora cucurbitarum]|uniref:Paired amphipathic helix protein Sin3b n=1 Tax=Choanephora cucurbitarum TaxID=101091 RepID=A0A1C7NDJ4_9FUNG|nr:Paired amphipathic helix protein Sin3b [Choanephora cucurbitarum]
MTLPKQQDTRSPIPPPILSYNHHLGITTLKSPQDRPSSRSLPPPPSVNTLTSLRSPYSPSSNSSPIVMKNVERNVRPALMSPTPSPSTTPFHPTELPPPPPPPPQVTADPSLTNQNTYRPLNVTDALSYLDLVKNRFSDRPDVYNQFLDIMKDFKSQAIDTPGVIKRVSSLFKGHSELISGFNTFLPAGYRIECPTGSHGIIVITPTETMTIENHPEKKKPPIEFNHAISYVNRIKNRFAYNPDIYKQFLEILQTYQKEQKSIGEVYAHVCYLFKDADDLVEEFKQFLPELMEPHGLKRHHQQSKTKKRPYVTKRAKLEKRDSEDLVDTQPVSSMEISLFDKIKQHIGNKPSYDEFLKLLNLYTQQIIDIHLLVTQAKRFIGQDKELFQAFQTVIGYDPQQSQTIERPAQSVPKPDLNKCPTIQASPSYRSVPRDWQTQPCSGRDQMCWEVLNDEYVSYPIWASEDSFVITSKRNLHEEALHRVEEERYDYDVHIEANQSAIALLRPIALQLEHMSDEEKEAMQLKPGLGGPTVSIYERMIKKVYDDDRGQEIIQMLYQKPAYVVPVLLNRLQLKDQEWRKAQREWNKIWREQEEMNFYKSLDYQGHSFKMNDKKALTTKAWLAEPHPITLAFENPAFFTSVSQLIYTFLDRQQSMSKEDREKLKEFIDSLTGYLFRSNPTKQKLDQLDLFATAAAFTAPQQEDMLYDKKIPFFCHTNYYCLVRLYHVLFERLYRLKSLSDQIKANPSLGKRCNTTAKELDLITTRFDDIDLSNGYYEAAIEIMDRFFKGEYDQNTFEENLRYVFGIDAYIVFTVDKVLQSLIKQIQTVWSDKKSIQLLTYYQEFKHPTDGVTMMSYHDKVIDLLGTHETIYQIDIDQETKKTTIYLLDQDKDVSEQRAYKDYLNSYIDWMNTTKGIDLSQLKPSFLSRTLQPNDYHFKYSRIRSQLRYKIQEKTYHMYYIVDSEDILHRKPLNVLQDNTSYKWNEWLTRKGNDTLSAQAKALFE